MITSAGLFDWAVQEPGPADRPKAPPYLGNQTTMQAIFHHRLEGYRGSYSALFDPTRHPTAWHGTVAFDGTLYQHYDVRLALQASNAGNFTGPAFELEGVAAKDGPINAAQLKTYLRIHRDIADFTRRIPKRVTGTFDYAALQKIPKGELWLLEHRQVGSTACPSESYAPLWAAIAAGQAAPEEANVTELEDLILSVWGAVGEETLPREVRLTNARYRMQEANAGRLQPLAGQIAEHTAKKAGAHG